MDCSEEAEGCGGLRVGTPLPGGWRDGGGKGAALPPWGGLGSPPALKTSWRPPHGIHPTASGASREGVLPAHLYEPLTPHRGTPTPPRGETWLGIAATRQPRRGTGHQARLGGPRHLPGPFRRRPPASCSPRAGSSGVAVEGRSRPLAEQVSASSPHPDKTNKTAHPTLMSILL